VYSVIKFIAWTARNMGLSLAWDLCKALLGAGLKLRQKRALEWVEMVRDNPEVFTGKLLENEEFQDGFVYTLEKYLIERSEEKRKIFRNIFLGFSCSKNKERFDLEKYSFLLSQLSIEDVETLKYVNVNSVISYQLFDDEIHLQNIYNLINLGILYLDPSPRFGPIHSPFVLTSDLGKNFIKYIKHDTK